MYSLMLSLITGCAPEPDIDTKTVVVEAGRYQIGPPPDVRAPSYTRPRTVTLTYDYAVSKTEVSMGDWIAVTHGYQTNFCGDATVTMLTLNHPVRCVSWCEALLFANKRVRLKAWIQYTFLVRIQTNSAMRSTAMKERSSLR